MQHEPLQVYVETYRRRSGLSQRELGFLLGGMCGRTVRRHEKGERDPNLRTVLVYEFVLRVSTQRLFKGTHVRVIREMEPRIRGLILSVKRQPETKLRNKKLAHLGALLAEADIVGGSSAFQ